MTVELLKIIDLEVSVDGVKILKGLSLRIKTGEVHAIMGRNGSGKSTLAFALMGHPAYEITKGSVTYRGKPLDELNVFERARAGMWVSAMRSWWTASPSRVSWPREPLPARC